MLPARRGQLWAEVIAIYLLGQLALWLALPYADLYAMIAAFTLLAIFLLTATPGFRWSSLWDLSSLRGAWGLIALSSAVLLVCVVVLALVLPDARFLSLPRERPELWIMVLLLYPWFSVLGQEVIYRTLFFARYEGLFPSALTAGLFNVLIFGIAHAFFERWSTFAMSLAAGGRVHARVYAHAIIPGGVPCALDCGRPRVHLWPRRLFLSRCDPSVALRRRALGHTLYVDLI